MDSSGDIRPAMPSDLDVVMGIYDIGRKTMRERGNHVQWINGYPLRQMIAEDIARGQLYVVEGDPSLIGEPAICGVFMFAIGDDPTYALIEDGAWLNDEPYGVIHRISSDGRTRGVLASAVRFALDQVENIRIDTHADNLAMQNALAKTGFRKCGIIYCEDGTPRVAFQRVAAEGTPR